MLLNFFFVLSQNSPEHMPQPFRVKFHHHSDTKKKKNAATPLGPSPRSHRRTGRLSQIMDKQTQIMDTSHAKNNYTPHPHITELTYPPKIDSIAVAGS